MPISIYNMVQTGPNNQFGGAHDGLASATYQVEICEIVTYDPIDATKKGISTEPINIGNSFNLNYSIILLSYLLKYITLFVGFFISKYFFTSASFQTYDFSSWSIDL